MRIQLGHPPGERCDFPHAAKTGFYVFDIDSVQEVNIFFCNCQHTADVGEDWQQLLRFRLFPATTVNPHTAFTFRALSFFHCLTLKGKVNLYDFYGAIERRTDSLGLLGLKVGKFSCISMHLLIFVVESIQGLRICHTPMALSKAANARGHCKPARAGSGFATIRPFGGFVPSLSSTPSQSTAELA